MLLGLSGGADSVCLLFALLGLKETYKLTLFAVHVNHGIRGDEAYRDQEFCRELCKQQGVDFQAVYIDVPLLAGETGESLEEAGRRARYDYFFHMAEEENYDKIAIAHHKDDQAETVLFQMIRGSRLTGLAGIRPQNGKVIRPLLCLDKKEIEEYLLKNNICFVTDSTNLENDASRNIIRHEVIPKLLMIQQGSVDHICETSDYLRKVDEYLEREAAKIYEKAVRCEEDKLVVNIKDLREADEVIAEKVIYQILCQVSGRKKDITHRHVENALALMDMQTGAKVDFKYGITGQKAFVSLIFTKKNRFDIDDSNCNNTGHATLSFSACVIERQEGESSRDFIDRAGGFGENGCRKLMDLEAVKKVYSEFSPEKVSCRPARATDYITVYKDGRKKKVFDLLMEARIPVDERGESMIAAYEDEAFIIYGVRGCEAYRVTDDTRYILVINIEN